MTALKEDYAEQIRSMKEEHSEAMSKLNEELTQSPADEKARVIDMEHHWIELGGPVCMESISGSSFVDRCGWTA